jgi:hypothetical protein
VQVRPSQAGPQLPRPRAQRRHGLARCSAGTDKPCRAWFAPSRAQPIPSHRLTTGFPPGPRRLGWGPRTKSDDPGDPPPEARDSARITPATPRRQVPGVLRREHRQHRQGSRHPGSTALMGRGGACGAKELSHQVVGPSRRPPALLDDAPADCSTCGRTFDVMSSTKPTSQPHLRLARATGTPGAPR